MGHLGGAEAAPLDQLADHRLVQLAGGPVLADPCGDGLDGLELQGRCSDRGVAGDEEVVPRRLDRPSGEAPAQRPGQPTGDTAERAEGSGEMEPCQPAPGGDQHLAGIGSARYQLQQRLELAELAAPAAAGQPAELADLDLDHTAETQSGGEERGGILLGQQLGRCVLMLKRLEQREWEPGVDVRFGAAHRASPSGSRPRS